MNNEAIWRSVEAERLRQAMKWSVDHSWGYGDCSSPHVPVTVKGLVLGEECGEVQQAVLDGDDAGMRQELVQVIAVAWAWLEGEPDPDPGLVPETPGQLSLFPAEHEENR